MRRLLVRSVAPTGAQSLAAQDALVRATHRAIESVSPKDAVVILRHVDLSLVADIEGDLHTLESALEMALRKKLAATLHSLRERAGSAAAFVTEQAAWFVSVGVHRAEALLASGKPPAWPFEDERAEEIWSELVEIERGEAATALAHLANTARRTETSPLWGDASVFGVRAPSPAVLRALLARFPVADDGDAPVVDAADDLLHEIWRLAPGQDEPSALARLALFFARRPHARDRPVPRTLVARPPPPERAAPRARPTEAVGLVLLAKLFGSDVERIVGAYDEERARRGFRVAVAIALEDARLRLDDPMLALFAGERPDVAGLPLGLLDAFDPAVGHRAALALAFPGTELDVAIAPLGRATQVFSGGVLIDELPQMPPHDAVPAVVERLRLLLGRGPSSLTVLERCPERVVDRWTEVDAPRLPDAWRPAARTVASIVAERLERDAQLTLRATRRRSGQLSWLGAHTYRLVLDDPHWYPRWPPRIALPDAVVSIDAASRR